MPALVGQSVERAQMSIKWWMDKQNVVYTFNEILLSLRKEVLTFAKNMDEFWEYSAKWNNHLQKINIVWFHLHEVLKEVIIDTKSRMGVFRGWDGNRRGCYYWPDTELLYCKTKTVLEMDSGIWLNNNKKVLSIP